MQSAGVEVARVVEGAVGGVLIVIALAVFGVYFVQWLRARRAKYDEAGSPALARFIDTDNTDSTTFGGGAWSARVRQRQNTVTYGYLAVAEEYLSEDSGGRWCTLTVSLPGRVPCVVADNRAAAGRSGVPMEMPYRVTLDDPPFDVTYSVGALDADDVPRVFSPEARAVLVRAPVQRLMLHESQLLLRSFDGVTLSEEVIASLDGIAARFLASTPSFVGVERAHAGTAVTRDSDEPLREGFYGPDAD